MAQAARSFGIETTATPSPLISPRRSNRRDAAASRRTATVAAAHSVQVCVGRVRRAGVGPTGLTGFAGYVRILRWDPVMTPVLLQNLPVIDARIRKVVDASVILEHTHFAGLWFQATAHAENVPQALVGMPAELVHQPQGALAAGAA